MADPRHDTLESLATHLARQAEAIAGSAGLRCRLDLPSALPPLTVYGPARHEVCLAVKEALHNVVKHAAATELRLLLELAAADLLISVVDDGRGLPAARDNGQGLGLDSIRRRLATLGGAVEWKTPAAGGTQVAFRIPIRSFTNPSPA